jgi:valyl-tRNA synthetase
MTQSTIMVVVLKFFAEKLWPWFKDYIWPHLREHLLEMVSWTFSRLKEKIKEYLEERSSQRQEEATQRALKAEESARNATNDAERQKHEALASVWREVAEQFREENELLKTKVQELTSAAELELVESARKNAPNVDTSSDTPVLVIGEKRTSLPPLPSSSGSKKR